MRQLKMAGLGMAFLLFFSACGKTQQIQIAGSTTMQPLMEILADDYARMQNGVKLDVRGGGSRLGISLLSEGKLDIAMTSNDIEGTILENLANPDFEDVPIAYDGIAIVVHQKNNLDKVTLEQLSGLFSGKIKNYREIGGPDLKVIPIIRNDNSGTALFMKNHILRKLDAGEKVFEENKNLEYASYSLVARDNKNVSDLVQINLGGIGFMGMVCAGMDEKKMKINVVSYARKEGEPFITPSVKSVHDGSYKLSRPLKLVYRPNNPLVDAFIVYALSERGQNRVVAAGHLRTSRATVEVRAKRINPGE